MAKKKLGFNMAKEIRSLLAENRKLSGREVRDALAKKFPKEKINAVSCGVAYSNARVKLGISRSVKRKKPVRKQAVTRKSSVTAVNIERLQAAKSYLAKCGGDETAAVAAVRQLSSLQIS